MATARGVAGRLAALPPEAVRQTKDLIKNGRDDVPGRIEEELACSATVALARGGGGVPGVRGEAKAGFFHVCLRASTP